MPIRLTTAVLVGFLAASCGSKLSKPGKDPGEALALSLALKDELEGTHEAVVWLYAPNGMPQSHWIKRSAAGTSSIAVRDDLVVPTPGALWRFPEIENPDDIDTIEIVDLVSGQAHRLVLDEAAMDDERDGISSLTGGADAGVSDTDSSDTALPEGPPTGDSEENDTDSSVEESCSSTVRQSNLAVVSSLGPYLFVRYEERTYDCEETLALLEDRFAAFDLTDGSRVELVTEADMEPLLETDDVRSLAREGTVNLVGIEPFFIPGFDLRLTYHFAVKSMFIADDGVRHSMVSTVQVPARELPAALIPYAHIPVFVSVFSLTAPGYTPGGHWLVDGTPEQVASQLAAFVHGPVPTEAEDE